jgi:hypothetical protein
MTARSAALRLWRWYTRALGRSEPVHDTGKEVPMTRSLAILAALLFVPIAALLVLLAPLSVGAQATQSGVFAVPAGGGQTIYAASANTNVLVTVCVVSGAVVGLRTSTIAIGQVGLGACTTFNVANVTELIVTAGPASTNGTYSVSTAVQ